MFIFDFVFGDAMDEIVDWIYSKIVGFLVDFFSVMGNMGVELFQLSWVQSIVLFFSNLAWALFVTGIVVAIFECAIEYQNGRGSMKDTALQMIKGFMATSLFSVVPIRLYELSISLQNSLAAGLTGRNDTVGDLAESIVSELSDKPTISEAVEVAVFGGFDNQISSIMMLFMIIMMGYAVIKVFFASLKRGGILLIQIAVGSLYMFSVPRGYMDGFVSWSKQIIGLCLTSFLQVIILTAGLMVLKDNAILGLGLMLSATEVPRIAGAFGLETSSKGSISSAVNTASMAINTTRTVRSFVAS